MRRSRMAAGAALVLAAALGAPATASAATASAATASAATASAVPWQPYRTAPWTDAPGAVCSFGVTAAIVADQEQYRTLSSYPDGDPRLQEFRGPLVIQYTNTSTGASVVRNLSGYAWFRYGSDGSIRAFIASHIGLTVDVGNAGFPAGEWVLSGQSVVSVSSTGAISARLIHATAENLCQTLS
jgi:hypothetical protein